MKLVRVSSLVALVVALTLTLSGCAAPLLLNATLLAGSVSSVGGLFKVVQLNSGGSVEVASDTSKLTDPQRERFRKVKTVAVWPDASSASVTFADELNGRNGIQVVTPARVTAALRERKQTEDLNTLTKTEVANLLNAVCKDTGSDAVIFARAAGGSSDTNLFSFQRANVTRVFDVVVHFKGDPASTFIFPATMKILIGAKAPDEIELVQAMVKEVARSLVEI